MREFTCPNCRGRGTYGYFPCPVCQGEGYNYISYGSIKCSTCNSSGRVVENSEICSVCHGTGHTHTLDTPEQTPLTQSSNQNAPATV